MSSQGLSDGGQGKDTFIENHFVKQIECVRQLEENVTYNLCIVIELAKTPPDESTCGHIIRKGH